MFNFRRTAKNFGQVFDRMMKNSQSAEDWIIDVDGECTCEVRVDVGWNMPGQTGCQKVGLVLSRDLKAFIGTHLPTHIYCRKVHFLPNMGGFFFKIILVKDNKRTENENRG